MPMIDWPVRRIQAATLSGALSDKFTVSQHNAMYLENGDEFTYEFLSSTNVKFRLKHWITHDSDDPSNTFGIALDANLTRMTQARPSFVIEIPVGVITNFPSRPILRDPGVVSNTSLSNPGRITSYSVGYPRYEGSVELDVGHRDDVPLVEAFIDQLHNPANWFELPLPDDLHMGETRVKSYNATDDSMVVIRTLEDSIHGMWGRVGWRTCKVTSDNNIVPHINDEGNQSGYEHTITITPSGLINGPSTQSSNIFSSATTLRVRATNVNAIGDTDFVASWTINFEENDGGATS